MKRIVSLFAAAVLSLGGLLVAPSVAQAASLTVHNPDGTRAVRVSCHRTLIWRGHNQWKIARVCHRIR